MDPNSQAYLMIPFSGPIQPQSDSESLDNPSQQSRYPSESFFPSFLPTWSSMRAGPSIPPFESPPSSGIFEVPPEASDDEMSVVKPLARRISTLNIDSSDDEMSPSVTVMGLHRQPAHKDSPTPTACKRVAAPTIRHDVVDNLRDKVRYSQSRVIKASVEKNQATIEKERLQHENDELRRNIALANQFFAGEMKAMEARYAADQENFQKQMLDLLTQSQNNLNALESSTEQKLKERDELLKSAWEQFKCQEQAINSAREELEHKEEDIAAANEHSERQARLLSERENENLGLRSQLQRAPVPATSNEPSNMPRRTGNGHFRNSRHTSVLRNLGITLGTIPLAPPLAQSPAPMVEDVGSPNLNAELPSSLTPEALQPLIKETLRQLGIQRTEQSGSQSSGPRHSTPTRKVKEQQRLMSKDIDKAWKTAVRDFWRQTYDRPTASHFHDYVPVLEARVKAVKNGAALPLTVLDSLDFSLGYERSRWNELVLKRLCRDLLEIRTIEGGWSLPDVSEDYVLGLLHGHLKRSHDAWATRKPRFSLTTGGIETKIEADQRADEAATARSNDAVCRSRRVSKLSRRFKVVTEVLALKTHSIAPDLEAWRCFQKMLNLLDVDGMSEEEESTRNLGGTTVTVYLVKLCPWRANEITQYLKLIDKESMNPALKASRGQGSHSAPRFPSNQGGATFKTGLPIGMYDPDWLSDRIRGWPEFEDDVLQVSKETFEFLVLATHA